jgi:hypothetical protein
MTDIDSAADIDIVWREHEVTVSIPLAGDIPVRPPPHNRRGPVSGLPLA